MSWPNCMVMGFTIDVFPPDLFPLLQIFIIYIDTNFFQMIFLFFNAKMSDFRESFAFVLSAVQISRTSLEEIRNVNRYINNLMKISRVGITCFEIIPFPCDTNCFRLVHFSICDFWLIYRSILKMGHF